MRTALAIALLALPLAAGAQTYRCVGKDGKKYYGQSVPPQCLGQPVEQLNAQGRVVKRFDAAATAAEREKKAAEDVERKKREAISKEEGRRNRALLATYTSEKDIEQARARALRENELAMADIEKRIAGLKQKQETLKKKMGESKDKAETGRMQQDIKNADFDIKTQEQLLETKKKEVAAINARYDDDKRRYVELTKGK
ncbi:MAG: DUF4124 domain-containing protein [Pseudomonadota bacterium]